MQFIRRAFSETYFLKTIVCVSLVAHMAVFFALLWLHGPYSFFLSPDGSLHDNDTQHYVIIAKNLAEGNGYSRFAEAPYEPDSLRTPLLPFYFVPFIYLGGLGTIWLAIMLLNILLALAPVVTYTIARFFVSHRMSSVAALGMVFEPLYLYRSQIAEPDALFVLFSLGAMLFLVRYWRTALSRDWYTVCAILGISILAKPSATYVTVIVCVFSIAHTFIFWRSQIRQRLLEISIGILIIVVCISPWALRNHAVFGVWGISSISGYNLYQYYTRPFALADEHLPESMLAVREPSRSLTYQSYFTHVALERIAHAPVTYAREHIIGSIRNLFVSDLPAIYYYGHADILPFPYNPESKISIHDVLSRGDTSALIAAIVHNIPKMIWVLGMIFIYSCALLGWVVSWRRDTTVFLLFSLFAALFVYFIVSSGPFVDAKYRLPAVPLVIIVSLYGITYLQTFFASKRAARLAK